jgi:hypothetical protein
MSRRLWFGVIVCVPLVAVVLALALGPKRGKIDTLGYESVDRASFCEREVERIKLGLWVPDTRAATFAGLARERIDAHARATLGTAAASKRLVIVPTEIGIPTCDSALRPRSSAELSVVSVVHDGEVKLLTWHYSTAGDAVCLTGNPADRLIAVESLRTITIGRLTDGDPQFPSEASGIAWSSNQQIADFRTAFQTVTDPNCTAGADLRPANNVDLRNRSMKRK